MSDSWTSSPNFWSAYSETYSTGIQNSSTQDVRINSQTVINATNFANAQPFLESTLAGITDFTVVGQHATSSNQGTLFGAFNYNNGGSDGAQFFGGSSRGSFASPSATQSGDFFMQYVATGTATNGIVSALNGGDIGYFKFLQDAAATATSAPLRIELLTTAAGNKLILYSSANATTPGLIAIQKSATNDNEVFRIESLATNDDPSERIFQGRAATTDATVTTLQTITIASGYSCLIRAIVTARRTGGSSGTANDSAGYERILMVKDVSGTATVVGAINNLFTAEDQAGWDCTIDVTGATARVRVTGAAANNITWHSTVKVYPLST